MRVKASRPAHLSERSGLRCPVHFRALTVLLQEDVVLGEGLAAGGWGRGSLLRMAALVPVGREALRLKQDQKPVREDNTRQGVLVSFFW